MKNLSDLANKHNLEFINENNPKILKKANKVNKIIDSFVFPNTKISKI